MAKMKRYSFSSNDRMRKSGEFKILYKKGKKIVTGHFILFFLGLTGGKSSRKLGITVTKGVGNAYQRNRIKRQVREAFRLTKEDLPCGSIVVKARITASKVDNASLRTDIEKGFKKLIGN